MYTHDTTASDTHTHTNAYAYAHGHIWSQHGECLKSGVRHIDPLRFELIYTTTIAPVPPSPHSKRARSSRRRHVRNSAAMAGRPPPPHHTRTLIYYHIIVSFLMAGTTEAAAATATAYKVSISKSPIHRRRWRCHSTCTHSTHRRNAARECDRLCVCVFGVRVCNVASRWGVDCTALTPFAAVTHSIQTERTYVRASTHSALSARMCAPC